MSKLENKLQKLYDEDMQMLRVLEQNEAVRQYIQLRDKIADSEAKLKEELLKYFEKTGEKRLESRFALASYVSRQNIKVVDEVPEEYMTLQPDMTKIKKAIKVLKKEIPGVQVSNTNFIQIRWGERFDDEESM